MRLSDRGIATLKGYETGATPAGKLLPNGEPALEAYLCPAGKWTIGWGQTGPGVTRGLRWTREQCQAAFDRTVASMSAALTRMLNGASTTQGQFDAMLLLMYNAGEAGFAGSTVLRRHRDGDHDGAANAFVMWNKVTDPRTGRKAPSRGLTIRREAEARIYRGG